MNDTKEVKYKIYQLSNLQDKEQCKVAFKDWSDVKSKFNKDYYEEVYSGSLESDLDVNVDECTAEILELIYSKFNANKPKDYKGRSLSTSDLVEINSKTYYCAWIGWVDITKYM